MKEETMNNQPQYTSLVPVYHWRGARPWLVDLEPYQTGWLVCLCLQREGDVCLLPLAWEAEAMPEEPCLDDCLPFPTLNTQALESTAVRLTLNDLQQSGWQINGRLTLHFTGCHTEPNFHQNTQHYLWHTPGGKDEG